MQENLQKVLEEARKQLENAKTLADAEDVRVKVMGKKGSLTQILRGMGKLSKEEKKAMGQSANEAKGIFAQLLEQKKAEIKKAAREARFLAETIDVTEPAAKVTIGVQHPVTQVINEIVDIFRSMGYSVYESPEVDTVYNTFDGLNSPEFHPARDMTDTFYIDKDIVLRPHTSSGEVRAEKELPLPYKIVIPGRCFRCDTPDATHSPTFHQVEMMVIGEGITMADLKGSLDHMAKKLFGPETRTKFRPHHFPFTEPSAEMDVSCFKCGGKGCNVCKGSGWIEILGCGMTHPHVHKAGGIDTEKYTGFAVGMGVERIAMLKYGIDDIRLLYENDMRFINQFK
ncbi:phenylalanine--tRNA ligase subunit alpha [Eubacterium sp. AB3007]|uniref:phenylalanine--tRNA ligase subunit alpha n=1 Tax=Eubacterium sp. AB3007 TaxID=1392487 RepID=UPI000486C7A3|nr:phenylalanine--tRNA ligase subunit alpha [Eubacterium sp. AB3007]